MGTIVKHIVTIVLLIASCSFAATSDVKDPNQAWQEMLVEITNIHKQYITASASIHNKIQRINKKIAVENSIEQKLNLLIEKDLLKDSLSILKFKSEADVSKIRYLKGLQIIRILYDKTLSLDHHFSSVRTFSEINKMANPNQYPEFDKLKELVSAKKDKKLGFDLTAILGTNTLVSVVNTFTNLLEYNKISSKHRCRLNASNSAQCK